MQALGVRFSPKQGVYGIVLILLALHPFLLVRVGTAPFYAGLPAWYWMNFLILGVMLLVTYYLVNDLERNSPTQGGEQ